MDMHFPHDARDAAMPLDAPRALRTVPFAVLLAEIAATPRRGRLGAPWPGASDAIERRIACFARGRDNRQRSAASREPIGAIGGFLPETTVEPASWDDGKEDVYGDRSAKFKAVPANLTAVDGGMAATPTEEQHD